MVILTSTGFVAMSQQQLDEGGKRAALRNSPTDHCRGYNGYRDYRGGSCYGRSYSKSQPV